MSVRKSRRPVLLALMASGIDQQDATAIRDKLIASLDASGFCIMPRTPTQSMLKSARGAVRGYGYFQGTPAQAADAKHAIRYQAMVATIRREMGLEDAGHGG